MQIKTSTNEKTSVFVTYQLCVSVYVCMWACVYVNVCKFLKGCMCFSLPSPMPCKPPKVKSIGLNPDDDPPSGEIWQTEHEEVKNHEFTGSVFAMPPPPTSPSLLAAPEGMWSSSSEIKHLHSIQKSLFKLRNPGMQDILRCAGAFCSLTIGLPWTGWLLTICLKAFRATVVEANSYRQMPPNVQVCEASLWQKS